MVEYIFKKEANYYNIKNVFQVVRCAFRKTTTMVTGFYNYVNRN